MSATETTTRQAAGQPAQRQLVAREDLPIVVAVGLLLVVALLLRLWGSSTGMPYSYMLDEAAYYVPQAIAMSNWDLNPGWFVNPPAFTYALHLAFSLFSFGSRGIEEQFARDPEPVWMLARGLSALLGTAAVGFTYLAGAKMFGRLAGLLAAGVLAVAFLPVFYGHFALNDSPALLPVAVALYGVAEILRSGSKRAYAIAGLGFGLAAATKYSAGVVLLPILIAFIFRRREDSLGRLAVVVGVGAAAFVVANPFSVLDPSTFLDGLSHQAEASSGSQGKLGQTGSGGVGFYFGALGWGVGWVPLIAAIAGGLVLAVRDRRRAILLIVPMLLFVLFMGTYSRWFGRWVMPVIPFACLLAGYGASALVARTASLPGWVRPAAAGLAAALLGFQGLAADIHLGEVLTHKDTRSIARNWMRQNIPRGAKIVVEPGVVPQRWLGKTISFSSPYVLIGEDFRRKSWNVLEQRREVLGRPEAYAETLSPGQLLRYRNAGWCWVVTASTQRGRVEQQPWKAPAAADYYRSLKKLATLEFTKRPWSTADPVPFDFDTSFNYRDAAYVRPGPEIRIYRMKGGRCVRPTQAAKG